MQPVLQVGLHLFIIIHIDAVVEERARQRRGARDQMVDVTLVLALRAIGHFRCEGSVATNIGASGAGAGDHEVQRVARDVAEVEVDHKRAVDGVALDTTYGLPFAALDMAVGLIGPQIAELAERRPIEALDGGGDGLGESGWILRGLRW